MNELIKELVKQAGGHFSTHTLTSYPAQRRESIELWDDKIEKFAELLVLECVQVCINEGKTYAVKSAGEYQAELFSNAIKKHFGVE